MLAGELLFYKNDQIIKSINDEEFSEFNPDQLIDFAKTTANEIGATKVVSSCVYHSGANGYIDTILYQAD